jgi:hypothetical protein
MYLPDDNLATRMANQERLPLPLEPYEVKKSGDRRHCKWCSKYKPDRCHHCRVCRTCILKMDHHCPWIYNCVGFCNYKYFFLLIMYGVIITHFICWTIWESVMSAVEDSAPFATMFMRVFGLTLAFWIALVITLFFLFHLWLMLKAMTIIEFCEKSASKNESGATGSWFPGSGYRSGYDRGVYGNICAVLGDNPLLWFFPMNPPTGDGMNFPRPLLTTNAVQYHQQPALPVRSQGTLPVPDSNARLLNPPMPGRLVDIPEGGQMPGSDADWPRLIPQSSSSIGTIPPPRYDYTHLGMPQSGSSDRPPMTNQRPSLAEGRQGMNHSPSMPYAPQPRMLDDTQVIDPSLYDPQRQRDAPAAPLYQP